MCTNESQRAAANTNVNSGGGSWYPPSIDLATGRVFWAIANPAPFPGTADFPNGSSRPGQNLYTDSTPVLDVRSGAATFQGNVLAYDRATGKEVWRWKAPGGINSWMSVSGDTLVIPVGSANPAVVVALSLHGPGNTPPTTGRGAAGSGAAGATGAAGSGGTGAATFSAIYADILSKRCAGPVCHGGGMTGGSLNVMAGGASATRSALVGKPASGSECASSNLSMVTPSQPDQSLLYRKLADMMPPCGSRMPPTGPLPAAELERIRTWISNGAADD